MEALALTMFVVGVVAGGLVWGRSKDGGWGDVIGLWMLVVYVWLVSEVGWLGATGLLLAAFGVMLVRWIREDKALWARKHKGASVPAEQ